MDSHVKSRPIRDRECIAAPLCSRCLARIPIVIFPAEGHDRTSQLQIGVFCRSCTRLFDRALESYFTQLRNEPAQTAPRRTFLGGVGPVGLFGIFVVAVATGFVFRIYWSWW